MGKVIAGMTMSLDGFVEDGEGSAGALSPDFAELADSPYLKAMQDETGVAYLFISHDLAVVRAFANRMVVMEEGRIVESGDTPDVLAEPKAQATRALIGAVPRLER